MPGCWPSRCAPAAAGSERSEDRAGRAGPGAVEVKLTDAGCDPATIKLDAGRTTFKITNAGTGRVSELEVLSGKRIFGEKENLIAGLSGSFTLDLQPGQYIAVVPGWDDRGDGHHHGRRHGGGELPPTRC